jgi:hypothetical protein
MIDDKIHCVHKNIVIDDKIDLLCVKNVVIDDMIDNKIYCMCKNIVIDYYG